MADFETLRAWDRHIPEENLRKALENGSVLVARMEGQLAGWLRYNLFWDSIPFLNLLYVREEYRGQGIGRALMAHWEAQMEGLGHRHVLTSTVACEQAQHFYYALGYEAAGGFFPPEEGYELILKKRLF